VLNNRRISFAVLYAEGATIVHYRTPQRDLTANPVSPLLLASSPNRNTVQRLKESEKAMIATQTSPFREPMTSKACRRTLQQVDLLMMIFSTMMTLPSKDLSIGRPSISVLARSPVVYLCVDPRHPRHGDARREDLDQSQ
jgi:hypothetical protein